MNFYDILKAVEAAKPNIVDLSTGSPILIPAVSAELVDAGMDMLKQHDSQVEIGSYDPLDGVSTLVQTLVEDLTHHFGRSVRSAEILITPGVQAALRYVFEALCQDGQRALYPLNLEYPGAVDRRVPVSTGSYRSEQIDGSHCRTGFDIGSLDWSGVGAVILSHPHNPTGRLWALNELESLYCCAVSNNSYLVLDETYGLPAAPLVAGPVFSFDRPNTVHLYSFSKLGLAAQRVGFVVASEDLVERLRAILRTNIILCPTFGQHLAGAAIRFLRKRPDLAAAFGTAYRDRWEMCEKILIEEGTIPKHGRLAVWEGGPFLWLELTGEVTSEKLFWMLLREGVAVTPGSALKVRSGIEFASVEALRIGLGKPLDQLKNGVHILSRTINRLS